MQKRAVSFLFHCFKNVVKHLFLFCGNSISLDSALFLSGRLESALLRRNRTRYQTWQKHLSQLLLTKQNNKNLCSLTRVCLYDQEDHVSSLPGELVEPPGGGVGGNGCSLVACQVSWKPLIWTEPSVTNWTRTMLVVEMITEGMSLPQNLPSWALVDDAPSRTCAQIPTFGLLPWQLTYHRSHSNTIMNRKETIRFVHKFHAESHWSTSFSFCCFQRFTSCRPLSLLSTTYLLNIHLGMCRCLFLVYFLQCQ